MPYDVTMPDGTVIHGVPEGTTKADLMRKYQAHANAQKPTSFWQGVGEEISKAAHNVQDFADTINPFMRLAKAAGLTSDKQTQAIRAKEQQAFDKSPYRGSGLGRAVGGIAATLPALAIPGGAIPQGAVGGAMLTDKRGLGVLGDMALGAAAGKVGDVVGKRVVAPAAQAIGRTAIVRKPVELATDALNKLGVPISALPLPQFTPAERAVQRAGPLDAVAQNLTDAQRLNLPYALADASPELRTLAGSVARKSTDARALAERTLVPRARGQAGRAVEAIDTHLAPITNINQRATDLVEAGKPVYGPLYDQAYDAPVISSPRLEQVLNTPAGREATARANTIAANEFRDPKAMGFVLDDAGNVVLTPSKPMTLTSAGDPGGEVVQQPGYTTQSLDYVKRGIDDILEPQRNPITGKLNLDEGGKAINGVQRALLNEVDTLNPTYAQAREAYGRFAKQAEALRTGHETLPNGNLPQRDFNAILDRNTAYDAALPPEYAAQLTVPELRRGYATAMADQANKMRLSANPYEAIYGGTDQQAKVAALFPEGSQDFARVYGLEQDMGKTLGETLGGSPTQARAMADQQFDALGPAVDVAGNLMTGGKLGLAKTALRAIADAKRVGMGKAKADAMAPALFNTDTTVALDYLKQLAMKQAQQRARDEAYRKAGGLLSFPFAASAVAGANPGP